MTNFTRVAEMNTAFGNPKGDPIIIDFDRVRSQTMNIADEFGETMIALGAHPATVKAAVENLKLACRPVMNGDHIDLNGVRDGLCDMHVFAYGSHHLMGIDADKDMNAVVDGVMTRFIKDHDDKNATILRHYNKGVSKVYFEGQFPTMVMKSAIDQPDAPKGKFLKSASYTDTVFPPI